MLRYVFIDQACQNDGARANLYSLSDRMADHGSSGSGSAGSLVVLVAGFQLSSPVMDTALVTLNYNTLPARL